MAKKKVKGNPIYTGQSVLVRWIHLEGQNDDEQPLGCICACKESGAKGTSKKMGLTQKEALIAALRRLLSKKKWINWVLDKTIRSWCDDYCEHCGGEIYAGVRISEDWVVQVCEICKTKSWGSTYRPPRRPAPFEF